MDKCDQDELELEMYRDLCENKEMIDKIKYNSEEYIKQLCMFASGRLEKNKYSEIYNDIRKKCNWTLKQRRVILLNLLNNLMPQELEEIIKKTNIKYKEEL